MSFPTVTDLLDNFNRANEGPPPSANWSTTDSPGLSVVGNQAAPGASGGNATAWDATTFGPDSEAYATVAVSQAVDEYMGLEARLADIITPGTRDGYGVYVVRRSGTDQWECYRLDNQIFTLLGATVTGPDVDPGDKIGIEIIGTTIKGYHFDGATWTEVLSRTDSTYTAAGFIGLHADGTVARWDDFHGGTVVEDEKQSYYASRSRSWR